MKPLFVFTKKKYAETFIKALEKEIEGYIALKEKDNKFYVYVDENNIQEKLIIGNKIYRKFTEAKHLGYDTCWIDVKGNEISIFLTPLYYAKLPKGRELNNEEYPIDINLFVQSIENCFQTPNNNVKIKYDKSDKSISFYIEFYYYDEEKAKNFIENYIRYLGVEKIYLYDFYGNILGKTEENKKELNSNMMTFFKKSLFISSIYNPLGKNIVPKTYKNEKRDGFRIRNHEIEVRDFNIRTIRGNKTMCWKDKIFGTFVLEETKTFDRYYDAYSGHYISINPFDFNMIDDAEFTTTIQKINSYYEGVDVTTEINLVRNCLGYDYEESCIRDNIFNDVPHHDVRQEVIIEEYYRIIDNNKLLHYSLIGNEFEIYNLPNNWKIENGLENLGDPQIFSSITNLSEDYENYSIIKELLENKNDNSLRKKKQ